MYHKKTEKWRKSRTSLDALLHTYSHSTGFWSIWVFIFLMMVACGFCCRRQRARRQAYLVVAQPGVDRHQPYVVQGYGAVGSAECAPIVYGPSPAVGATPGYGAAPTYGYVHTGVVSLLLFSFLFIVLSNSFHQSYWMEDHNIDAMLVRKR